MSRISQFYFNDNVGDLRSSQDFFDQISDGFDVYDDGYKFYVRTGVYVLNPPARVLADANTMQHYGRIGASQHVNFRMWSNCWTNDDGIVSANGWYMASSGAGISTTTPAVGTGSYSSLVLRSQDEFTTYKFTDTAPYVHQHVTLANGIPFLFSSTIYLGDTSGLFSTHRANVLKSHDGGETWTPVLPDGIQYKVTQVAYLNSTYFIVSDHGIFYSTDAYANTWNRLNGPFTSDPYSTNYYARSAYGTTPVNATYPVSIAWDGTRYSVFLDANFTISSAGTSNTAIMVYNTTLSDDGWIKASLNESGNTPLKHVYVNNKTFAMFKGRGFQYSSSGTSYSQTNLPSTSTTVEVRDILWDSTNSRYWISTSGGVYQSSDGINFTAVTGTSGSHSEVKILSNVVYTANDRSWVAKSTSGNAMTVTQQTTPIRGCRIAIANSKIFVYGSNTAYMTSAPVGPGAYGAIRTTTDGTTFTDKFAIGPLRQFYVDAAANCMIICQANCITKFNATTQMYTTHFVADREANCIVKTANNLYTIAGKYTSDWVTWSNPTGFTGNCFEMAISSNGLIMAVNSTAAYYSTSNGTTWTTITGGASETITYGDGVFLGFSWSNSQNVMISTNGTSFQAGAFINSLSLAFRGATFDSFTKHFYLIPWFQGYGFVTTPHTDPFSGKIRALSVNPYANSDVIITNPDQHLANSGGYSTMVFDRDQSRTIAVVNSASPGYANVANVNVSWVARANDLIFMSYYFTNSRPFGTPNTMNSLKYASTIGTFVRDAVSTGSVHAPYQSSTLYWKNYTIQSCTKFDGKYYLPSMLNGVGWSQFKKDIIYVPGDGTQFLRIY